MDKRYVGKSKRLALPLAKGVSSIRIFQSKRFRKWAESQNLKDAALRNAVKEILNGLLDADLGGGLIKKRIALEGKGKRGGVRAVIAYRRKNRAFFIYGFAKNEKSNIDKDEMDALKELCNFYLCLDDVQIQKALDEKELYEVI